MKQDLKTLFEKNRHALLDMGLRNNTLLSLTATPHTLDVIDEHSEHVFSTLVEHNKAMTLIPFSGEMEDEYKNIISLHNLQAENNKNSVGKSYKDVILKTALSKKELDSQLLKINANALNLLQEQGSDALYLATGFLTWFEDINSFKPRHAPLILVPVELFRCEAGANYQLRYTGGDLGTNLTLLTKLKDEFGLDLPLFEKRDEDASLEEYFSKIKQIVFKKARWCVETDKIVLGFFHFNTFYIHHDLSEQAWPENRQPQNMPLIQKLFNDGFEEDRDLLEKTPINTNKTEFLHLVADADSSQTHAILSTRTGANLVIQGAPGTGKTQTITNIISQGLADNKKILFIAQKIAALDAVSQRLHDAQLGSTILELYAQKAENKSVIRSLENAFLQDIPELNAERRHEDIEHLVYLRNKLDLYCQLINSPIGNTQINYHQALGYLTLHEDTLLAHNIEPESFLSESLDLAIWDQNHYQQALNKIHEVVEYLNEYGNPCDNIYASTQKDFLSPNELTHIRDDISALISLYQSQLEQVHTLAQQMGLSADFVSVADLERVTLSLSYLDKKPDLIGIKTESATWLNDGDSIVKLAQEASVLHEAINTLKGIFKPEAFHYNWQEVRHIFVDKGDKYWRFMSSEYRKAKNILFSMTVNGIEGDADDWIQYIDDLVRINKIQTDFDMKANILKEVLGIHYQNSSSQWSVLIPTLQWLNDVRKKLAVGDLDQGLEFYLIAQNKHVIEESALIALNQTCHGFKQKVSEICHALALNKDEFDLQFYDLTINKITKLSTDLDNIDSLTYFTHLRNELERLDCGKWGEIAKKWQQESSLLSEAFQYTYYLSLTTDYYQKTAEIRQFDRNEHEGVLKQFKEIDKRLLDYAQMDILQKIHARMQSSPHEEERDILLLEFSKKRHHLPNRELLAAAHLSIQEIKPVFIMTPSTVPTYLEPDMFEFDMVIIDEASQLCTMDALPALMRAKQVIVLGDVNQMTPKQSLGAPFILSDDDIESAVTPEKESILAAFIKNNAPTCYLRCHYRSQHESLFAISNTLFYADQLMALPSSTAHQDVKGIQLSYLSETSYDSNETKRNLGEAKAIATAIMEHAKKYPNTSLGVITLSIMQRDTILSELEKLRKKNPEFESFFYEQNINKDFFVKCIECVQGDERDTIFISMTYGKNPEGKLPLDFALLNGAEGEKRLNVLFTRAKKNVSLFCNFTADELEITDKTPNAICILKNILKYAAQPQSTNKQVISTPLVDTIAASIRAFGYFAEPQITDAGFYINIAIKDPHSTASSMLSVICDNVTGEYKETTRDRERLRQAILETRGWRFHSLWSTDWFRNRHTEIQRIQEAVVESLNQLQITDKNVQPYRSLQLNEEMILANINTVFSYQTCPLNDLSLKKGDQLASISTPTLSNEISKIIDIESPLHIGQLSIRLMTSIGGMKTTKKINNAILDAVAQLVKKGKIEIDGDFLLLPDNEIAIRSRQDLPVIEKKFEFIYDNEIVQLMMLILDEAISLHREQLITLTAYALGFTTCSKVTKLRIIDILQKLEEAETVKVKGDIFSL